MAALPGTTEASQPLRARSTNKVKRGDVKYVKCIPVEQAKADSASDVLGETSSSDSDRGRHGGAVGSAGPAETTRRARSVPPVPAEEGPSLPPPPAVPPRRPDPAEPEFSGDDDDPIAVPDAQAEEGPPLQPPVVPPPRPDPAEPEFSGDDDDPIAVPDVQALAGRGRGWGTGDRRAPHRTWAADIRGDANAQLKYDGVSQITAHCKHAEHGRLCRLRRSLRANDRNAAQGRPGGLLLAWLEAAGTYDSQQSHQAAGRKNSLDMVGAFSLANRQRCRSWADGDPEVRACLAELERPPRPGEGHEPRLWA